MAENPIGTTDEERLVPLRVRDGEFRLDVTRPVRTVDASAGEPVAWRLREAGDVDRLLLVPVDDADEAGALPASELSETNGSITARVPETLIADGLGLDPDSYDGDNPLLFEPETVADDVAVGMEPSGEPGDVAETAVELTPVRFSDGTPFGDEPLSESALDSDPVAETVSEREEGAEGAPRSDAISAPVDPGLVDDVIQTGDASREAVVEALETMARRGLVTEADNEAEARPVVEDDRAVVGLESDTFERKVTANLDADRTTVEAVHAIHARQADALLERAGASSRGFATLNPVVVQPDTRDESAAQPET